MIFPIVEAQPEAGMEAIRRYNEYFVSKFGLLVNTLSRSHVIKGMNLKAS